VVGRVFGITAQRVQQSGVGFVFSDGHGIARFTKWFDNLGDLDKVDWDAVYARNWSDTVEEPDRRRMKRSKAGPTQEVAFLPTLICSRFHPRLPASRFQGQARERGNTR